MARETEDAREARLKRFIETMKSEKCMALIEPLRHKIKAFDEGKIPAGDIFRTAHYVAREGDRVTGDFKKRPDVILAGIAMAENMHITGIGGMGVKVRKGSLTSIFTDAIVNPAHPTGSMESGVAGAIRKAGGEEIEREAVSMAPLEAGSAVSTGAGKLANLFVIHAPTQNETGALSSPELVKRAAVAALTLAEELECVSLAIPGMGTGAGKVTAGDSARAIIEALKSHTGTNVTDVILIDRSDEMVQAFIAELERYDEEDA